MSTIEHSQTPAPVEAGPIIQALTEASHKTAAEVVPWFLSQMPRAYFQDTDEATRLTHLQAIIAARASGQPVSVTLKREDGAAWTFINQRDDSGLLASFLTRLPRVRPLTAAKVHSARDGSLAVDVFQFGEQSPAPADDAEAGRARQAMADWARTSDEAAEVRETVFARHLARCTFEYLRTVTPIRALAHWRLVRQVEGLDATAVSLEPEAAFPGLWRVTVAADGVDPRVMLERLAERFGRRGLDIRRAYLDVFLPGEGAPEGATSVATLGFVVRPPEGVPFGEGSALWAGLRRTLWRIRWLDDRVLSRAGGVEGLDDGGLDIDGTEVMVALCDLAHQKLTKENPWAFARTRVLHHAERHRELTNRLVELFLRRFDPADPLSEAAWHAGLDTLLEALPRKVDTPDARRVLQALVEGARATLRTNVHRARRFALSLRLSPDYLTDTERPERSSRPFGVFFMHGRGFNGFHVRFRDIARGGVRAVRTRDAEHHALESERLYDECYGLAFAQQLKNKDIPEGGSKGVALLEPGVPVAQAVKAYGDAMLDLIAPPVEGEPVGVDRLGREELIYLGPDENLTDDLIVWLVERARSRSYALPDAFMSSKPGAGINHKTYGVTSEGVTVFLDEALRAVGIDPHNQPFTVAITGGPDGDVAGNEMKILNREYGANARIIGVADGSGSAEDPDGLDHEELLRLVTAGLAIDQFDPSKLGPQGEVVPLSAPDGVTRRNTLHARLTVDALLPCGGRPNTVHAGNWQALVNDEGQCRARAIVEGANLFLTGEARAALSEETGVLIVKDSSANKCGVICSSFEIAASMLLPAETFMGIKATFVEEVLDRLRAVARQEARLLLRERTHHPEESLPAISVRVSRAINRAGDSVVTALDSLSPEARTELQQALAVTHLPPSLVETAGVDRVAALPSAYLDRIIACSLGARVVYREGLAFIEGLQDEALGALALSYLNGDREAARLAAEVESSDLPNRDRIAALLLQGGARAALEQG